MHACGGLLFCRLFQVSIEDGLRQFVEWYRSDEYRPEFAEVRRACPALPIFFWCLQMS